jgi:thiol-disulfide isomerase/thioredoxin
MKHRSPIILVTVLWVAVIAAAADVRTITHGREVDLDDHLVENKYVLFDFYADWCGPCRALEPHLEELASRHADRLAIRKIDVINWDSAVARQYRLSSIPHLVLYGPNAERLAAGDAGSVLHRLSTELGGDNPLAARAPSPGAAPFVIVSAVALVVFALLYRRRAAAEKRPEATIPAPVDTTAMPGDPAIWFAVLQGSLEGPFTRGQLSDMVGRGLLAPSSEVRRRGDANWTSAGDVVG